MHELLVPAGDMECLRQAVYNGCDAVYLACKTFGARKFAKNFDNDEIVEALKFCHLYGVRVYVTMNTLVKNNEVDEFLDQVDFLHKNGVDALIMQDFGMICLVREMYPNLEIHASTQANISSRDICKLYYDLGVKRVVFSRELSIDEIDSIDIPIEKEAFIHGALCISYSGECLMSSMLGGRSGNRGECAGSCRLPYTLKEGNKVISKNKYLLSTKELNTSSKIDRLLNSSIYSFKIEGRMKSPLYVGFITRLYRSLINKKEINFEEETNKLKTIYNRDFTLGRLFKASDQDLMNTTSPNHIGLEIGKVLEVTKDKIKIKLNKGMELHQYDAIRFLNSKKGLIINFLYDNKNNLINSSTDICYIDNKIELQEIDVVSKTGDYLLGKEFDHVERKVNVSINVIAKKNSNLIVEYSDGVNVLKVEKDIIEESINNPISEESIKKQLMKLGNTPFICTDFNIEMDNNIFIRIKDLNDIRRELVEELIDIRSNSKVKYLKKEVSFNKTNYTGNRKITCSVYNEEQLKACLESNVDRIYIKNLDLYNKYKEDNRIYYYLDRCLFDIKSNLKDRNLVSDFADYNNYNVIGNYTLNVTNIYTAYYLSKIGIKTITLSVELSDSELDDFIYRYNDKFGSLEFEILSFGRIENMLIKGNILDILENKKYELIDLNNRTFPVFFDGVNTHILNYDKINGYNNKCNIRYDFYDEDESEIKNILLK